jgi:hypothetical protein
MESDGFTGWRCLMNNHRGHNCHAAHIPILRAHGHLVDIVPATWLRMTLLSLCAIEDVTTEELDSLVDLARRRLSQVVILEQDLARREYRWETLKKIDIDGRAGTP